MAWTEPNFTKGVVRRAGDYFSIEDEIDFDPYIFLMHHAVLSNWRASHAYPMQSMLVYFRKKAKEADRNAIIAQRLKRSPSIIAKLKRESGMRLDRIEDIAGCRIVVSSLADVYRVRDSILKGRTRNTLKRERDYILTPKSSGYRGIHLIYKYNGHKINFRGHHIELQIRSLIQHSWATAVEVVGTFTKQALKASEGLEEWLQFFRLTSLAFEDIENKRLHSNAGHPDRKKLIDLITHLNVLPKLEAFKVTTNHINKNKNLKAEYYLLTLDIEQSNVRIQRFSSANLQQATEQYAALEKQCKEIKDKDVVLITAESISALKKAYPNYFADTTDFSKTIEKILEANIRAMRQERDKLVDEHEKLLKLARLLGSK